MKELLVCPNCGFRFEISYGRAFACSGCGYSVTGSCGMAKCPKCGHEFNI